MKVICIGSASKDIFFPTNEGTIAETPDNLLCKRIISFELGAKYRVENRYESTGGCAANVAIGLARLGVKTECYSKVGDDKLGDWIINELKKENVGTGHIQREKNCSSDLSAVIVDKCSGERTIFFNRDANEKLEIIPENLAGADWFFVSALNGCKAECWEDHLEKILNIAEKGKIKLAFNPGPENIKRNPEKIIEAIKKTELLMVNKDEALEIITHIEKNERREKMDSEVYLMGKLANLRPKIITLTDGLRGAWACEGKKIVSAESEGGKPVETTGAGDSFSAAFLAAIVKWKNPEEALRWGIINSGNVVKFYGAREGLLNEAEIKKREREVIVKYL